VKIELDLPCGTLVPEEANGVLRSRYEGEVSRSVAYAILREHMPDGMQDPDVQDFPDRALR